MPDLETRLAGILEEWRGYIVEGIEAARKSGCHDAAAIPPAPLVAHRIVQELPPRAGVSDLVEAIQAVAADQQKQTADALRSWRYHLMHEACERLKGNLGPDDEITEDPDQIARAIWSAHQSAILGRLG